MGYKELCEAIANELVIMREILSPQRDWYNADVEGDISACLERIQFFITPDNKKGEL
jgi:hypothetical protein